MSRLDVTETVAAISSPTGPSLRGIVRLTGPKSHAIASGVTVKNRLNLPGFVASIHARLQLSPADRSYTGQPLAEIHTVGSGPILQEVLSQCFATGARPAAPGEFTLRAFLSGRLDLTRAEAVLGVIHARSKEQLESALAQLAGGLADPIGRLRDRLLDVLAHLEAGLDFVDEADVDAIGRTHLVEELDEASARLSKLASQLGSRNRADAAPRVVLVGRPNVGKSRLFNAIARESLAIVSPYAGTTRDDLTAHCRFDGFELTLVDTAGESDPAAGIEAAAQKRRQHAASEADLQLICRPASEGAPHSSPGARALFVATQCDLAPAPPGTLASSALTGLGLSELRQAIVARLRDSSAGEQGQMTTAPRCRDAIERASVGLRRASQAIDAEAGDELVAMDLRQVLDDLGEVVGAVVTDDILDRIFSRFCIGK
jgi:tRNA modification GTPase